MRSREKERVGETFVERYVLKRLLGAGGMGEVYLAEDLHSSGAVVALKILHEVAEDWKSRFEYEFSILSTLSHPNLVRVYDFSSDPESGRTFYTSEFLEGQSLAQQNTKLSADDLVQLLVQICRALRFIHSRGIVHGDVKPGNILRNPKTGEFVLADFGLARTKGNVGDAFVSGTPAYMAPELFRGAPADPRTDLFALGATVFRLATGAFPHESKLLQTTSNASPDLPSLRKERPDLPLGLDEVVSRLLQWNLDARFGAASQVIHALARKLQKQIPVVTPETLPAEAAAGWLVGRHGALTDIHSQLEKSHTSLLLGPLGIGKSRVLEEVRRNLLLEKKRVVLLSGGAALSGALSLLQSLFHLLREDAPMTSGRGIAWDELSRAFEEITKKKDFYLLIDDVDQIESHDSEQLIPLLTKCALANGSRFHVCVTSERTFSDEKMWRFWSRVELQPFAEREVEYYAMIFEPEVHPRIVLELTRSTEGSPLLLRLAAEKFVGAPQRLRDPAYAEDIAQFHLGELQPQLMEHPILELSTTNRSLAEIIALAGTAVPRSLLEKELSDAPRLFSSGILRVTGDRGEWVLPSSPLIAEALKSLLPRKVREERLHQVVDLLLKWERRFPSDLLPIHSRLAEIYGELGEVPLAIPRLKASLEQLLAVHSNLRALRLFENVPLDPNKVSSSQREDSELLYLMVADLYSRTGNYRKSLETLSKVQRESAHTPEVLRKRADALLRLGRLDEAEKTLDQAESALSTVADSLRVLEKIKLKSLRQYAAYLARNSEQVLQLAETIEKSSSSELLRERLRSLNLRGHLEREAGRLPEAIELYRSLLHLSQREEHASGCSTAWGSLGLCYQVERRWSDAIDAYTKAIDFAAKASDVRALSTHRTNLATLLERTGAYGRALSIVEENVRLQEQLLLEEERAHLIYRKAALLYELWSDAEVTALAQEVEQLSMKLGLEKLVAYARLLLARVESDENESCKLLSETRAQFENEKDLDGLHACALLEFERWAVKGKELRTLDTMEAPELIRFLEAESRHGLPSPPSDMLLRAEEIIRDHPNPEWLARWRALEAQRHLQKGEVTQAMALAEEARKLFEGCSASFESEVDQQNYLSKRMQLLEGLISEFPTLLTAPTADSFEIREVSTSRRVAQHLSQEAVGQLMGMIRNISEQTHDDRVADLLTDCAVRLTGAERGFLCIQEGGGFRVLSARNIARQWIAASESAINRRVVSAAIDQQRVVHSENLLEVLSGDSLSGAQASRFGSMVCIPFHLPAGMVGALYLDAPHSMGRFHRLQIFFAEALAEHAAIALERTRMLRDLREKTAQIEYLYRRLEQDFSSAKTQLETHRRPEEWSRLFPEILGKSQAMRLVLDLVSRSASSNASVYLFGESGTGKEMMARALHAQSTRNKGPFVPVNCSSVPSELFESLFFGHLKGSFTGAEADQSGFFVAANGGTLFLDEVSELPLEQQAKLLRTLETAHVRRVGDTAEIPVDVRLITASNRPLEKLVQEGKFREDLFYRIHVIRIELPRLRDRTEDIPILAEHFLKESAKEKGIPSPTLDSEALSFLMSLPWPGNIRQLRNEIERITVLLPKLSSKAATITKSMLQGIAKSSVRSAPLSGKETLKAVLDQVTVELLSNTLRETQWNKSRASRRLGLSRNGLDNLIKRLRIKQL